MKKIITLLTILTIAQVSFGQKVKIKKNVVTIDKEVIGMIEEDNVNIGSFYINDSKNEQKLYLKWIVWSGSSYFEVYKADDLDSILFETSAGIGFRKWIFKTLYNSKVLTSSGVDEIKLIELSKKIGKEFTRQRT